LDINYLWVGDQGSNAANERLIPPVEPVGTVWKVDLTNFNNNPTVFTRGNYLSRNVTNLALGNAQDIAVDPSTGNLYLAQYGYYDYAGSVVSVNSSATQAILKQDDGSQLHPSNPQLGYYVAANGWDSNYFNTGVTRVITDALENLRNPVENTRAGHLEAVDPINNGTATEVTVNSAQNNYYIATPGGVITYSSSGAAPVPSAGHSPTTLGSIDVSAPDTMDLSSTTSAPGGAGPAMNNLATGIIEQFSGFSNLADSYVPDARVDGFWKKHEGRTVLHSILTEGFQTKDNPWSMQDA
jgi:hypothetical protein